MTLTVVPHIQICMTCLVVQCKLWYKIDCSCAWDAVILHTLSNRQAKSMWTQSPVDMSISIFSPCLSPRPNMCPTMHQTAVVLVNANLAFSQAAGSVNVDKKKLCSNGGNSLRTLFIKSAILRPYRTFHAKSPNHTTEHDDMNTNMHIRIAMDHQIAMAFDVDINITAQCNCSLQLSVQNLIETEDNHISSAPRKLAASCQLVQGLK